MLGAQDKEILSRNVSHRDPPYIKKFPSTFRGGIFFFAEYNLQFCQVSQSLTQWTEQDTHVNISNCKE